MTIESTTYDSTTTWNKRGKPSLIRIESGNQGRIHFSVSAVNLLGLKEGSRIAFRCYKNDAGIIYFYEQATGIQLKKVHQCKSGISLAIYCRPLGEQMLKHFGYTKDTYKTFLLKADQVTMPGTNCQAWFITKENIHKPIQWRKKT